MLVDGEPGIVVAPAGRLHLVMKFLVVGELIDHIEVIADQTRLEGVKLVRIDG